MLYDGTCGFCDASIQWLLAHDRGRRLRYAALQSETGRALTARFSERLEGVDSLVVVDGRPAREAVHVYSNAVIAIASVLPFPWALGRHLGVVPARLRDALYRFVARHRLRIRGRLASCRIPSPGERALFLP